LRVNCWVAELIMTLPSKYRARTTQAPSKHPASCPASGNGSGELFV